MKRAALPVTLHELQKGNLRVLARTISQVENEEGNYFELLSQLPASTAKVIGITGPPGAGKSTITDALIELIVKNNQRAGVLCVDPSSPFSHGALLGDRVRMNAWYNHPSVFIRSLASRGSLGGLHPKIIEITDVLKAASFDYIIIETVGVGQSEVEIAGVADLTLVMLVPGAGDDIQIMKAGLMEIADIFVVNKADRPGADSLVKNIYAQLQLGNQKEETVILKTVASQKMGISELFEAVNVKLNQSNTGQKKHQVLVEKAYQLIIKKRMKDVDKKKLGQLIKEASLTENFNLYQFVDALF